MAQPNLCAQMSDRPETVEIVGRITGATGVIAAPASGPKYTCTRASAGVYNIVFTYPVAEYLGTSISIEGAAVPGANTAILNALTNWTQATNTLTVTIFNSAATPAATDANFAFDVIVGDSVVP